MRKPLRIDGCGGGGRARIGLICVLFVAPVFGADVELDWITGRMVTRTTEKAEHQSDGALSKVAIKRELKLNVHQTEDETRAPDEVGILRTVSLKRTTVVTDTRGGKLTVEQEQSGQDGELRIVRITEHNVTQNGTTTTIKVCKEAGGLAVTRRVTVEHDANGTKITTVEEPGPDGDLVITSITTER